MPLLRGPALAGTASRTRRDPRLCGDTARVGGRRGMMVALDGDHAMRPLLILALLVGIGAACSEEPAPEAGCLQETSGVISASA